MQYTTENTEGYSSEDLETLNRIYEHRIDLLGEDELESPDYLQHISEQTEQDYAGLFLQVSWDLQLIDPLTRSPVPGAVLVDLQSVIHEDEPILYLFAVPEVGLVPLLRYPNGEQFTPKDWQAGYRSLPEDRRESREWIGETAWVYQDGRPAIMLRGLPRVLG